MKLLFVIDMQNNFIDGALGSPEAQAIVAACCAGSTPEWHEKALDMLEHCHFNVINRDKE